MGHREKINIAISCDRNYVTPLYVLLTSIFTTNKGSNINLHLILSGIANSEKKRIVEFATENEVQLNFYDIDEKLVSNFPVHNSHSLTSAIYYRLFFPSLVPKEVKKLIYLDTDIIVVGNLEDLYTIDINRLPVAAVPDNYDSPRVDLGINDIGEYFNSGVLLINTKEWLEQKITEKTILYIQKNPEKLWFGDQCALNAVLFNNWYKLNIRFNLMFPDTPRFLPNKDVRNFLNDKLIVHFTTKHKPWSYKCSNPYKYLYREYLFKSPVSKSAKLYTDFVFSKKCILEYFQIRLNEFYYNFPIVNKVWRKLKYLRSNNSHIT